MSFLKRKFSKGTIIRSQKKCIHIKTGRETGEHYGVVHYQKNNETFFNIFTHSKKGTNKVIDKKKFSNNFHEKYLDDNTYISEALFKN